MLFDQQQTPTETLQEYVQRFSDLLFKSSGLLLHQATDLAHITHFICNLHNQKLQHYVLGKNPTSVLNAITLAQKTDVEFCIIEGFHNHDSCNEVNNIYNKQNNNQNNMGPCHACNGQHLERDCNESICNRCRPHVNNHKPAKCIRKRSPNRQQKSNPSYNNNNIRNQSTGNNDPNVQLSISTSKLDHTVEMLEATKKMTRYFKKSYKHNKPHFNNTDSQHPSTKHYNATHSDKHKCKSHNTNDQVNEIIGQTYASKTTKSDPEDIKDPP